MVFEHQKVSDCALCSNVNVPCLYKPGIQNFRFAWLARAQVISTLCCVNITTTKKNSSQARLLSRASSERSVEQVSVSTNKSMNSHTWQINPAPSWAFQRLSTALPLFHSCFVQLNKCLVKDNLLLKPFFPCMGRKLCVSPPQVVAKCR